MKKGKNRYVFQRVEKKYLLSEDKYNLFMERIEPYMVQDHYGLHTICNIYYDTDTYELIRHSIEKPEYKEKFRIRSYGVPNKDDTVFLEIKKKWDGTVYKRRIPLTLDEVKKYLDTYEDSTFASQISKEIKYFFRFYQPSPKLFLAYDRIAFFGKDNSDVRITFDQNIRSRHDELDLAAGDYGRTLLDSSLYLMEIKVPSAFPMWLSSILSELKIYPTSFSKYGNIYKRDLVESTAKQKVVNSKYNFIEEGRVQPCLPVY